jgi:hypothetical protein
VGGGGLAILCGAAPPPAEPKPQDVLASRLTLVDAKGKKRIALAVNRETDEPTLAMVDSDGNLRVALMVTKEGPELMFIENKDQGKLQLGIINGLARVVMFDGPKEGGITLVADPEEGSLIRMADPNGDARLRIRTEPERTMFATYDKGDVVRLHLEAGKATGVLLRSKNQARELELAALDEEAAIVLREPRLRAFRLWLPKGGDAAIQTQFKNEKLVPWKP